MQTNSSKNRGFSLVEILITLSIFSITLLSLGQIAFEAGQATNQNYFETKALILAHNAYEKNYHLIIHQSIPEAAEILPDGEGSISSNFENLHIEISWLNHSAKQRNQLCLNV